MPQFELLVVCSFIASLLSRCYQVDLYSKPLSKLVNRDCLYIVNDFYQACFVEENFIQECFVGFKKLFGSGTGITVNKRFSFCCENVDILIWP